MSPEQAAGDTEVGVAGDVYGLACVFYEMLAGRAAVPGRHRARDDGEAGYREAAAAAGCSAPTRRPVSSACSRKRWPRTPRSAIRRILEFCDALTRARTEPSRPFAMTTRTIAVLPFVNSSPDPDNEYLSDGITDELINALAKVEGLRVASRTSVFALKGKAQDVRAIGALLEASEVLEGTRAPVGRATFASPSSSRRRRTGV